MADDSDNEVRISIVLDDGSVREGFARIQQAGQDTGNSLGGSFESAKNQLLALIGAYIGFEAGKAFIEESIAAAGDYEKAVNDLNKALFASGQFSADASQQFQDLASHIADTTTTSDKQALSLEAMALNYTRTAEQAKALTVASIDLASATGKSATAALQQLGGTLDGTAGRLAKLVPAIKSMTEYQLRSGDAISLVAARFKDFAAGDVNTFQGAMAKLSNSFEDLQIAFGQIITSSPTVRAVLAFLTEQIQQFAAAFKSLGGNDNFMKELASDAIVVGKALNDFLIYPIELFYNTMKVVFDGVGTLMVGLVGSLADLAAHIVGFFSPDSATAKSLNNFVSDSKELIVQMATNTKSALDDIGNSNFTDKLAAGLDGLQVAVNNAKPFQSMKNDIGEVKQNLLGLSGEITSVGQAWKLFGTGAAGELQILKNDAVKQCQEIGVAFVKGIGTGVGNAFAQMGKAMVNGQDMFAAFSAALLSAFGQALIQLGTGYIAIGLARIISSYGADGTGWGLVAQGGVLATIGGALSAVGSNSAPSAGSASSAGSSASAVSDNSTGATTTNPAVATTPTETQTVQVNINGSVFDSAETGLRIVTLVNDAFNTQGAQVLVK